jgi:hypothetical protein
MFGSVVNGELAVIWKEAVMIKALSSRLPGRTEDNYE